MKSQFLIILSIFFLASFSEAKTFSRCELVRELLRQGFPRGQLADWHCLVRFESGYRTHVVGPPNSNGSRDYGLFQINDRYWCTRGRPGGDCNVDCNALLTDNISVASACARRIFQRHGFNAWYGWINNCRGRAPSINDCL